MKRVSVVIPAYNEAALLPACLDSLAAQDYAGAIEVIVVDNASDDATPAIAAARGVIV
ncbi:MAG: glycosyltransferase family 2 protein, partial [Hyphomicrobiales bacterium]